MCARIFIQMSNCTEIQHSRRFQNYCGVTKTLKLFCSLIMSKTVFVSSSRFRLLISYRRTQILDHPSSATTLRRNSVLMSLFAQFSHVNIGLLKGLFPIRCFTRLTRYPSIAKRTSVLF